MHIRAVISIAAIVGLAAPATALTPPYMLCAEEDGTLAEFINSYDETDDTMPGMTIFETRNPGQEAKSRRFVIAHCATGQALKWRVNRDDWDTEDAINTMIWEEKTLTLRQLARRIDAIDGAWAQFTRIDKRHCACRPETHEQAF